MTIGLILKLNALAKHLRGVTELNHTNQSAQFVKHRHLIGLHSANWSQSALLIRPVLLHVVTQHLLISAMCVTRNSIIRRNSACLSRGQQGTRQFLSKCHSYSVANDCPRHFVVEPPLYVSIESFLVIPRRDGEYSTLSTLPKKVTK
jgi:hypothetical protein